VKYLFLALYAILGFDIEITSPLSLINTELWAKMKSSFSIIKDFCNVVLTSKFHFHSNDKLIQIRKNFIDIYDVSRELILAMNDKNLILL